MSKREGRVQTIMSGADFGDRLVALRREANAAGDELQASLCNSAIRGNVDHRYACAVVMADAEAGQS